MVRHFMIVGAAQLARDAALHIDDVTLKILGTFECRNFL